MAKDEQRRKRWPGFEDLLDPHMREKKWWAPLGDEESLKQACNEIRRFSKQTEWSAERRETVIASIKQLAFRFRFNQWGEWMQERLQQLQHTSSKTKLGN